MRLVVITVSAALVALLGLGTILILNLHALVEVQRGELLARGERALERPITIGAVTPSWWPLGIRLADVTIGEDPRFGSGAFLDAAAVRIRLRAWPLALGRVEVVGFVLDHPHVTLVRDADGRWNVASLGIKNDARENGKPGRRRRDAPRVPLEWMVGVALSEVRDGRIEVEDRAGPVPHRLTADRVRLRAENVRLGGEARLRAHAALFPGSAGADAHLDLRVANLGVNDAENTPFNATIELEDVDLATVLVLAGRPGDAAGRVASVTVDLAGTLARFVATVKLHAGGEPLRVGRRLTLPPFPARLEARVVREGERVTLEDGKGTIGGLTFTATGAIDVDSWGGELSLTSTEGALELAVGKPPLVLRELHSRFTFAPGVVHVGPAHARLDDAPVEITADVTRLDPPALTGRFQAGAFGGVVDGTVAASDGERVTFDLRARALDAGALASRLEPETGARMSGRLDGTLTLAVPVRDATWPDALTGTGSFTLADATLRDMNLAEWVLGHVREVGLVPRLLTARTRARYPELFDAKHTIITTATASFDVGERRMRTERLVVTTAPYDVLASGWIDFDGHMRFAGDLVLSSALSATLRADVPAAKYLAGEDGHVSVPFRLRGPFGLARPEPDLKRLRKRGLELLRETRADRRDGPGRRERRDHAGTTHDVDPGAAVIESLERMLRP